MSNEKHYTSLIWNVCRISFISSLLLFASGTAIADNTDANTISHLPKYVVEKNDSNSLRTIGAYPEERGLGHTITPLPDGRIFVYGHSFGANSIDAVPLDPRFRTAEKNNLATLMWDPKLQAWRKIDNPPECQFMAYLHTATALPDDRILIAGGLCDIPHGREDKRAHHSHTDLSIWNDKKAEWEAAPSLLEARIYHSATLLADQGVLLVGGESDIRVSENVEPVLRSVELFRDGKISQLPRLLFARAKHTATRMADGNVMVVGGMGADGNAMASVEIWNPIKKSWSDGPALKTPRYGHTAALLSDGRLMVAGGMYQTNGNLDSVEIFDPVKNEWADAAPLLLPLQRLSSLVLDKDNVLVTGTGFYGDHPYSEIMLWEKATEQWRPAGHLFPDRYNGSQSYLLAPIPSRKESALVFDFRVVMQWSPSVETRTNISSYGERGGYTSVLLNDGQIMMAGGENIFHRAISFGSGVDWVEIFDPLSAKFSLTGRLAETMLSPNVLVLDDGRVIAAGDRKKSAILRVSKTKLPQRDSVHQLESERSGQWFSFEQQANLPEIWTQATGKWSVIKELQGAGVDWRSLQKFEKLRDGRVLFLFENFNAGNSKYQALIWNASIGKIELKQVGIKVRTLENVAVTPYGKVLVVGGRSRQNDGEILEPEAWDCDSGKVEKLSAFSQLNLGRIGILPLRNGDVLWMGGPHAKPETAVVSLSGATVGIWHHLPSILTDNADDWETQNLLELKDGTIVTDTLWLRPGAKSWTPVQRFPQKQAKITQLPSGQLLALSTSPPHAAYFNENLMQWKIEANYYIQRKEKPKPSVLKLADGRMMVSGVIDSAGLSKDSVTQIWNPQNNTWENSGKLAGAYTGMTESILLPSGQVLHLGIQSGGSLKCEIGHPKDNAWVDCGSSTPLVKTRSKFTVGSLPDGRVVLMFAEGEAYSYNEQNKQWLTFNGDLPAVRNTLKLANGTFTLPDGCLISGPPFHIFNPTTRKDIYPTVPVTGLRSDTSSMAVLDDGTVVLAGYPEGATGLGYGFFHRKASCNGFEAEKGDELFMPGIFASQPTLPVEQKVASPSSGWLSSDSTLMRYKWVFVAILVPVFLYFFLRKVILRMNASDTGLVLPPQVERITRTLIYALGISAIIYVIWPTRVEFLQKDKEKSVPSGSIPCRFVGVWSSSRSGSENRITLMGNGRFATDPIKNYAGTTEVYTGTWGVKEGKMFWQYGEEIEGPPDVNPIHQESSGAFTLIEVNGEQSKFKLLEKIKPGSCTP